MGCEGLDRRSDRFRRRGGLLDRDGQRGVVEQLSEDGLGASGAVKVGLFQGRRRGFVETLNGAGVSLPAGGGFLVAVEVEFAAALFGHVAQDFVGAFDEARAGAGALEARDVGH